MTMLGQNGNANLDTILFIDSSFEASFLSGKESQYKKIITFDLDSHNSLSELNIQHDISDVYLDTCELQEIQQKTYYLSKWSKQTEISSLLEYDGINLGNLLYNDFIDYIAGFLKKFCEITKIVQTHQNCEFHVSHGLFGIANILSKNVRLNNNKIIQRRSDAIKYSYRLGQRSFSISISKAKYLKLKNLSELFLHAVLRSSNPKSNNEYVVLVELDPTKYKKLLFAAKTSQLPLLLYNRRWPTVWNFESFNVIRKSNCKIATIKTLTDGKLNAEISEARYAIEQNMCALWNNDFFNSFFSFNGISFWSALKPFFDEKLTQRMKEGGQEIKIAKRLFQKYNIKAILILSEIGPNEQVMLHLARKNKARVITMQHGIPYETPKAAERNNLSGFFPNLSDSMIVWGNMTKQHLEDSGVIPTKINPLGNPAYDDLFDNKTSMGKTILLATSPPMKDLVYDNLIETNEKYEHAIKTICEIVTSLNQKLVIKLHPSMVDFDIESLARKISDKIIVVKSGSIFPLIRNCKTLITFDLSTTILEAQILQKPAISIDLKNYGFGESKIFESKSCLNIKISDLEKTLKEILNNPSFRKNLIKNGNVFVDAYLVNKGSASKHILNFLSKL